MTARLTQAAKALVFRLGFDPNPELTTVEKFVSELSAELPRDARVLDAGAGECQYRSRFAHTEYFAADLTIGDSGWDFSGLDTVCALHRTPFRSGSFDAIVCTQVMEHVNNPAAVLAEFFRILRPGGCVYISCPFASGEHQIPYDYFRYTRYAWDHLLRNAGFDIAYIRPVGGYFFRLLCELRVSGAYLKGSLWHLPFLAFQLFLAAFLRRLEARDRDQANTGSFHVKALKPAQAGGPRP